MNIRKISRFNLFLYLGPAIISLLVVGIIPFVYAVYTSLHYFNLVKLKDKAFIGLENYIAVLTDSVFWEAMERTFLLLIIVLPIQIVLGLCIAMLLHRPGLVFLKTLTRLSLVVPMATTYAVVGLLGQIMFNIKYGVINQILVWFGFPEQINWIGDPTNAFLAVVFWEVWQWTPFCTLIFLAGLSMVPVEIEEASQLETKSNFTVLRYVQIPYLIPGLIAIMILRTADILKLFDMVFTMTRGGPGASTEFISLMIQRVGFRAFDQGVASAQAVILLFITIVLSKLYIRFFYKDVK